MIETGQGFRVAPFPEANQGTLMGATVHKYMESAIFVPRRDDRYFAHPRRLEITGVGDLNFQANVIPNGSSEDALLLCGINLLV